MLGSLHDSSSMMQLLSAADGMVGKKRTFNRGDEHDCSICSSCTACCRTNRGFVLIIDDLPEWKKRQWLTAVDFWCFLDFGTISTTSEFLVKIIAIFKNFFFFTHHVLPSTMVSVWSMLHWTVTVEKWMYWLLCQTLTNHSLSSINLNLVMFS